jgi:exonuclease VII small subunit
MLNGITILQRARKELAKIVEEGNQEILSFGLSDQDATMLRAFEGTLKSLDEILDRLEELEYELEFGGV